MCEFFKKHKQGYGRTVAAFAVLVPLVVYLLSKKDPNTLALCLGWSFSAGASVGIGWFLRDLKKCPLPHVAENVEVERNDADGELQQEQEQREGEPEAVQMQVFRIG